MFDNRARPQLAALSAEHRPGHRRPRRQRLRAVRLAVGRLRRDPGRRRRRPARTASARRKARDARRVRGTLRAALEEVRERAPDGRGVRRRLPAAAARVGLVPGRRLHRGRRRLGPRHRRRCSTARSGRRPRTSGRRTSTSIPTSLGHDICAGDEAWVNGPAHGLRRGGGLPPVPGGDARDGARRLRDGDRRDGAPARGERRPAGDAVVLSADGPAPQDDGDGGDPAGEEQR